MIFPKKMESQEFNQMLAYLSGIFTCINDLSIFMQGKNISNSKCREKLNAFNEKLHLCCQKVRRGNVSHFPSLEEIVDDDESLIPSM